MGTPGLQCWRTAYALRAGLWGLGMGLRDEMAADAASIVGDLPSEFSWAGAIYACFATTEQRELMISTRGNGAEVSLALMVMKDQFANSIPPQSGQKISFEGRYYSVDRVRDLRDAGAAWLYCIDGRKSP